MSKTWDGLDVPAGETGDTEILIWEVDPHMSSSADFLWCRGWQDMLDYVTSHLEEWLETFTEEELLDIQATVHFRLKKVRKSEYDELVNRGTE